MRGRIAMSSKQLKIVVVFLAILAISSILLAACSRPGTVSTTTGTTPTASGSGSSGGGVAGCASGTVHMDSSNFVQKCVNISKGSQVTLIDDVPVLHIITNGTWSNGSPQLSKEPGAPTINNVNISGGSTAIGPFNTAGKFKILCTVHVDMNLEVNVS